MQNQNNTEELNQAEYLYDLLQKIREKCGMYLGTPSITRLDSFLIGYKACRRDLGIPGTEQEGEFY